MATIHELLPVPPQAAPAPPEPDIFTLIAAGILAAGRGPETIPSIVAGFSRAPEMERQIAGAMAVLQASAPWAR